MTAPKGRYLSGSFCEEDHKLLKQFIKIMGGPVILAIAARSAGLSSFPCRREDSAPRKVIAPPDFILAKFWAGPRKRLDEPFIDGLYVQGKRRIREG